MHYKIVDLDENMELKFLYHGHEGSRKIKKNRWMKAKRRKVRDGSGDRYYMSGFHVFDDIENATEYLYKYFKRSIDNKVIIPVQCKNLKPKKFSKGKVFLAEYMKVI